jgi:P4 family phage/plasmid primase-like protien
MKRDYFNPPLARIGEVVPTELKDQQIWLLWKAVKKAGKPKPDKVPYYANGAVRSGSLGKPEDVANLVTFGEAVAAYNAAPRRYAGIGVALLSGMDIGALDLDDCIDASGKPVSDLDVRRILRACKDCYIERSPSGLGLRVIGSTEGFSQIADKGTGFEAYSKGRFMTVTGEMVRNAGAWESIDAGVAAMRLAVQAKGGGSGTPGKKVRAKGVNLSTHAPDPETPENVERVRGALATMEPVMGYFDWRDIGMALRSTEWQCAEDLLREWSRGDENYTDAAFYKLWNSIKPEGGITLGTLFHMAKAAGWEDPRRVRLSSVLSLGGTEERDVLNGKVFADHWRGRLIRVDQTGDVLRFDPVVGWTKASDSANAIRKAARESIAQISALGVALLKDGQTDKSQKVTKHAAASSTLPRMDAMADVGWTHDGMTVSAAELDAESDLLGVRDGVLDLHKRALRAFCPDDLITKRANVDFDPEAAAPQFEAFLARVQPDAAVRRLLQQIAGLTLWGKPGEQRLFFFHGGGANGKTTFVEALIYVLGGYGVSIQAEALMRQERSSQGPSADTLRLQGARGAFASEVREGRLDEERVKLWTGGDVLTARPVYGRSFIDFAPSHTFIMTGNHRPAIHDTSVGIWRRVTLIDWGVQIPEHEQDARLPERLRCEGSGILNWALDGLEDYRASGLVVPPSVRAATERYRTDEDIIGQFISERCRLGSDLSCPTGDLYGEYSGWAAGNGIRAAAKNTFTRRLRDRGHELVNSRRDYAGIAPRHKTTLVQ